MKKFVAVVILTVLTVCFPALAAENQPAPMAVKAEKNKKQQEEKFELSPYWLSYNDEILTGYVEEALENNLTVKIAEDRIKESEAILGTVNAQRLPQLSINPSVYPFKTISRLLLLNDI